MHYSWGTTVWQYIIKNIIYMGKQVANSNMWRKLMQSRNIEVKITLCCATGISEAVGWQKIRTW